MEVETVALGRAPEAELIPEPTGEGNPLAYPKSLDLVASVSCT